MGVKVGLKLSGEDHR